MFGLFKIEKSKAARKLADNVLGSVVRMRSCQAMEHPRQFLKSDEAAVDRDFAAAVLVAGIASGAHLYDGFETGINAVLADLKSFLSESFPGISDRIDACLFCVSGMESPDEFKKVMAAPGWVEKICPLTRAVAIQRATVLWAMSQILRSPNDADSLYKEIGTDLSGRARWFSMTAKDLFARGLK